MPSPPPSEPNAVVPPQSLEAEESVLGACLLSGDAIDAVVDIVGSGDFYRHSHGLIFAAAVAMRNRNEPVDAITMVEELERRGELDEVGGRARLTELAALVPATGNAAHYAAIVRETALLRGLVRAGSEIARLGQERPGDIENLLDRAERAVFDLSRDRSTVGMEPIMPALEDTFRRMQHTAEGGGMLGVPTGLEALDRLLGGLEPGVLCVVAARPSMGKSGLALTVARNVAIGGVPTAVMSVEMGRTEVTQRFLSMHAHVPLFRIRRGLKPEDWPIVAAAADRLSKAPLFLDYGGASTITQIRSVLRRQKTRTPELGLVVIDYLQLVGSDLDTRATTNDKVAQVSRECKLLAKELDVPVVLLSQLNRAVELRNDKRPMLSDLRDSGAIEQDADIVVFVYRDHHYNPDTADPAVAELIVAKHRNGPTDTATVAWDARTASFGNLARHHQEAA